MQCNATTHKSANVTSPLMLAFNSNSMSKFNSSRNFRPSCWLRSSEELCCFSLSRVSVTPPCTCPFSSFRSLLFGCGFGFGFGFDLAGRKGRSRKDEGVSSVTGSIFLCCGFDCGCCDCWAFRRRARRDCEREGFVVVVVGGV